MQQQMMMVPMMVTSSAPGNSNITTQVPVGMTVMPQAGIVMQPQVNNQGMIVQGMPQAQPQPHGNTTTQWNPVMMHRQTIVQQQGQVQNQYQNHNKDNSCAQTSTPYGHTSSNNSCERQTSQTHPIPQPLPVQSMPVRVQEAVGLTMMYPNVVMQQSPNMEM